MLIGTFELKYFNQGNSDNSEKYFSMEVVQLNVHAEGNSLPKYL